MSNLIFLKIQNIQKELMNFFKSLMLSKVKFKDLKQLPGNEQR